jgi:hypothetical protein
VEPASNAKATIDWVHRVLKEERDIVISSRPLKATAFRVDNIRIAYVFYESGLSINVMYIVDDPKKRAVGFKLSEGMEVPAKLASRIKDGFGSSIVSVGGNAQRRRTPRDSLQQITGVTALQGQVIRVVRSRITRAGRLLGSCGMSEPHRGSSSPVRMGPRPWSLWLPQAARS